MRNTVILVDQIESDVRERGLTRGARRSCSRPLRRARPVALTALAAILAMIPLSESAFWGPMALTIMGGLSVATFLTLFLRRRSMRSGSANRWGQRRRFAGADARGGRTAPRFRRRDAAE